MTFKQVVKPIENRSDQDIGLFVIEFVMQNRLDHDKIYRSGEVLDFCNKEMKRVHDGLEAVAEAKEVRKPKGETEMLKLCERLEKHRPISVICYAYDAIKGVYQDTRGEPMIRILEAAEFAGERIRRGSLQKPETIKEYYWSRESIRQEYVRILTTMRNGLSDRTSIIYDMFK